MSHYRMHRGWMETPALNVKGEPFCRRAAWAWLIEKANWKAAKIDVGGRTVEVQRGQLSYSFRYIAKAWNWSHHKVQLFIDRLVTDTMISTATDTGQLLITICNYEKYQASADTSGTPQGTVANTLRVQHGYESKEGKEGYKNGEERGGVDSNPAREPDPPPPPPPNPPSEKSANVVPINRQARELKPCDVGWTVPEEWQAWAASLNHASVDIAGRRFKQHWRLRQKRCMAMSQDDLRESWEVWILEDLNRERNNGGGHHGSESDRLRHGLGLAFSDCMDAGPEDSSSGGGGFTFRHR